MVQCVFLMVDIPHRKRIFTTDTRKLTRYFSSFAEWTCKRRSWSCLLCYPDEARFKLSHAPSALAPAPSPAEDTVCPACVSVSITTDLRCACGVSPVFPAFQLVEGPFSVSGMESRRRLFREDPQTLETNHQSQLVSHHNDATK
jgi:hypothetical protein